MKITEIKDPSFLKEASIIELNVLANDIRQFLIETISKTGGHLSSNLGVVELTIALHYVFNAPIDKILFDVGHQCYTHKILTGRSKKMSNLRQYKGISGFQKRNESIYDCFEAGHSSTSLSTALGMATARDLNNEEYQIIDVIGDGSLMSGLSFEALNNIGYQKKKIIIIFNDNNMSISKNVGALSMSFSRLRTSNAYNSLKTETKEILNKSGIGKVIASSIHHTKKAIKKHVIDSGIFKEFNIDYLGPVDGHNIEDLIKAFNTAKNNPGPIVVHVLTKKGKGYKPCEEDKVGKWHGVGKFDIETGNFIENTDNKYINYSKLVSETVEDLMSKNNDILTITPAMISGSSLNNIFDKYPDRAFDCGIAEDHAALFASGLALNGKKPFLSIYSTFLQRAYDQINHDICRMNLPVVLGIDRAGLVGEDGETHHGVFDISFLRSLPNMIIAQGKDYNEIRNLLYTAFKTNSPFSIRYPKGKVLRQYNNDYEEIKIGSWTYALKHIRPRSTVITYGNDVDILSEALKGSGLRTDVVNARFIKPIDEKILDEIIANNTTIFIYTSDIIKGGLGDEILEYLNRKGINRQVFIIGIDNIYVKQGNNEVLKKNLNLDIDYLLKYIKENA